MPTKIRNFYIPNSALWNQRLIAESFVRVQLQSARRSYRETDGALRIIEDDIEKIRQEIKGQWASANVQVMRAFESRLKEMSKDAKRIGYVRYRLRSEIDRMLEISEMRKWNLE